MIYTDYYLGKKAPGKKTRYDIIASSQSYDLFEKLLINKKDPNAGGLSFYCVDRPERWGDRSERKTDKAITKSTTNISSIIVPDPEIAIGYGDVRTTDDALTIIFSQDWDVIEVFIARGQKNNKLNLYQLAVDGELDAEMAAKRQIAVDAIGNH